LDSNLPVSHRACLADVHVRHILSAKGASGVFPAAPWRTGKSTVLH